MGLVVLGHGKDGDEGDGAALAQLPPRPLIEGGQIGVEVAGVAPASGHLLLGGGHLAQGLGVVGDVGHDDQHVHALLEGQVLGGGEGHAGGGDALHRRVVGQVCEEHRPVDGAGAAELLYEEVGLLEGDADGGKDHGEVARVVPQHPGLPGDLGGQGRVGQARAGEDGQLLAAHQGIQAVDGGDARLDELVGVVPGGGVHGQAVDVPVLLGQNLRAAVDGLAHTVEHPAQHVAGHAQLEGVAQEAHLGLGQVDARGGLKELNHGVVAVDLQHLAAAHGAVGQLNLPQLVVGDAGHPAHHHQGAVDLLYGTVFLDHSSAPPRAAMSAICSSISRAMSA